MKQPPSRRMPKKCQPSELGWFGNSVFIAILAALFAAPVFFVSGGVLWIYGAAIPIAMATLYFEGRGQMKQREKTAAERKEENICTFARELNCREVDTWIVRAVYEELVDYFGYPPHLDDRFDKVDPFDIDDMATSIAKRIGRPLKNLGSNPRMGKVNTVRELILFFTAQTLEERPVQDGPALAK